MSRNGRWLPRVRVNFQPSASISLSASLTFIRVFCVNFVPDATGLCGSGRTRGKSDEASEGEHSSRVANLLDSLPSQETKNVSGTVENSEDFDTIFERPVQDQNLLEA